MLEMTTAISTPGRRPSRMDRAMARKFDPRPVLMIRFPNQSDSEVRSEAFPLLGIHGILEAMLKGEIRSQADLDHWLAVHEAAGEQVLAEKGE